MILHLHAGKMVLWEQIGQSSFLDQRHVPNSTLHNLRTRWQLCNFRRGTPAFGVHRSITHVDQWCASRHPDLSILKHLEAHPMLVGAGSCEFTCTCCSCKCAPPSAARGGNPPWAGLGPAPTNSLYPPTLIYFREFNGSRTRIFLVVIN